jgi:hypothetical protein
VSAASFLRTIRTKEWKLVRSYPSRNADHLYRLSDDPGETRNLYYPQRFSADINGENLDPGPVDDPYGAVRRDLEHRLTQWQESIQDGALEIEAADRAAAERHTARWSN